MQEKRNLYITTNFDCNLDCIYCYEKGKRNKSVFSVDRARTLLTDFLGKKEDRAFTVINFNGGEPFLVFKEIKDLCEWSWNQNFQTCFMFFATSNGTLIHGEVKQWLEKHKDKFWVGLSIDGNKIMHDINRSNSFNKIDIDFFAKTWPRQGVKMTLSPMSVPYLSDGLKFLHSKFEKVICNFAQLMDWSDSNCLQTYKQELKKMVDYYLENPQVTPCSMLAENLSRVHNTNDIKKWCGAGNEMTVYDIDGKSYPCHLFFESMNPQKKSLDLDKVDFINAHLDSECADCPIVQLCPTCYGANYIDRGSISLRDKTYCSYYYENVKAVCTIEYLRIKNQTNQENSDDSNKRTYLNVRKLEAIDIIMQKIEERDALSCTLSNAN